MARTWMTETPRARGGVDIYMPDYLPVTIYADTTRQYSEEEIDEMMNDTWGQMMEIPVPEDLLFQWWCDDQYDSKLYWGKHAWETATREEFEKWFYEESTADDTDTLYAWLIAHNYFWKRLD